MSSSTADPHPGPAFPRLKRRLRALGVTLLVVFLLWYAARSFVGIYSNLLWFRSVQHESVYTRTFWTQVLLFGIFGGLMAAFVAANLVVFHRWRPPFAFDRRQQSWRWRFSRIELRLRRWLFVLIVGYFGVTMGSRAAGSWQTWLMWRHSTSFGTKDPQFHRDVSYYVFIYPFHRLVVTYLFRIDATALIVVLVAAYAYGGTRLRGTGPRMSRAVRTQVTVLIGLYLVLKAGAYWLDRFALVTSNRGVVTGLAYTDIHAVLPSRLVLIVIALVSAGLLFASAIIRKPALMVGGLGLMVAGAFLVGVAWPAIVQQFREKPAASTLELPSIANNIAATRSAYGLDNDLTVTSFSTHSSPDLTGEALDAQAKQNQIRLLDPNQLSPTFTVKQEIQGYYGFKSTLDIDRYPLDGKTQDVALAVRELNLSGTTRNSWATNHLVYTHGNGVVMAPTDRMPGGVPKFVEKDLPTTGPIPISQPEIYYGQMSPSYSIVGAPAGSKPQEFNLPTPGGPGNPGYTTHTGGGGVPISSVLNRAVYAWKLHSSSVLLSGDINKDSQLLTVRNPRARVAAVAPWLTLDGDTYPTIVNGHILWVVDGYTTSNSYPDSQQTSLRSDTTSTLTQSGSTVTQPSTSINYVRNSVKATVDAYTGQVTLYAWNQQNDPDPILSTWEKAFPGLIHNQSQIPAALLPHLRYPQDLFNIQRAVLTKYHVTSPNAFYSGSTFWKVPTDPTVAATKKLNAVGATVKTSAPSLASAYMSLSPTGDSTGQFALSTPLVTLSSLNLSAFLSVDSTPGPDYGHLTLLQLPASQSAEAPLQIQNDIESDSKINSVLTLERGGKSNVVLGNLLTIPLGNKFLYVEPVYIQATGTSFPILRHVIAEYGNGGSPAFKPTLKGALRDALASGSGGSSSSTTTPTSSSGSTTPADSPSPSAGTSTASTAATPETTPTSASGPASSPPPTPSG